MRVSVNKSGSTISAVSMAGGTLTGSLVLVNNPVQPLEAASKQYVDSAVNSHSNDAMIHLTTGEKSLVGSITASATEINRLTGITGVVQTQLDTKAILAGSTLTGFLTLSANPTSNLHLATKQYVDTAMAGASGIPVADIIRKPYTTTPTGFLRCNGAYVSKTTYSALFAVIGSTFDVSLVPGLDYTSYGAVGAGQPHRQQYDLNSEQTTDITGWTTGTALPGPLAWSQAIVTKNRVYLLGGLASVYISTVYTAPINADGTLGTWATGTSLPGILNQSQAIVTKNRVYLLGGFNGTAFVSTVYTAPINADGSIGTWTTGTSLPGILIRSQAIVTKNRVYLLGGNNGTTYVSTVYTAPINADGSIGTWTTGTALPGILCYTQAIVTKNRVYLLGGYNGTTHVSILYTAPINADGTLGTWATGTSLPGILIQSQAIVTKNRVYLLGGNNGTTYVSTVYTAPINADGFIGTWTTGTALPGILGLSQAIVTKNRVYILGGYNSTAIATVYTAPILGSTNDLSFCYDGTVNKFDGTSPVGTTNPDSATLFGLPDTTTADANINKVYSYIKY